MTRLQDWPDLLAMYVQSRATAPFEWGTHDCCRFAAGAVEAVTGTNPMAAFDYRNETGAMRLIRDAGTLEALVRETLGEPLGGVLQARRGDVVMAELEHGPTVGVCCGVFCAYAAEEGGLVYRPLSTARLAWRIG